MDPTAEYGERLCGNYEARHVPPWTPATLAISARQFPSDAMPWTVADVFRSGALFILAGLAEIGGGWLVWQHVRGAKPWWWTLIGAAALIAYGFIPTLQPAAASDDFGRVSACYGGVFIASVESTRTEARTTGYSNTIMASGATVTGMPVTRRRAE